MSNTPSTVIRNLSFAVLGILLVVLTIFSFVTYNAGLSSSGVAGFAFRYHTQIMGVLLLIAIGFGFASSKLFYDQIKKGRRDSKRMLDTVLLFLNQEERAIVNLLVQNSGSTSQAEVARLPHMSRVKAHRSLQKMQEKQIIEIVPHGKVRKIRLREHILELLLEQK